MPKLGIGFSESFKRQVVSEVESGIITPGAAREKYGIPGHSTILRWRRKYGEGPPPKGPDGGAQTGQVASLRNEVKLLKQELEQARMRAVAMETLVDIAEQTYKIPIRKNCGAKQ